MKRRALDRRLSAHGCESSSAVPRHPAIRDELVRKICRDLGIDPPDHS